MVEWVVVGGCGWSWRDGERGRSDRTEVWRWVSGVVVVVVCGRREEGERTVCGRWVSVGGGGEEDFVVFFSTPTMNMIRPCTMKEIQSMNKINATS